MNFENYSIRPLQEGDDAAFFNLIDRNRPRLESFFSGTVARTRNFEEATAYLKEIITKAENKLYLPFAIIDNATGSMAGFVDIKNIDWNIPKAELGFFIDSGYEGQHISTKAFALFTDHCFAELGFRKLFLRTHESNVAAKRLAENCGFQVEGILRSDYKTTAGELVNLIYYGRLADR